MKSPAFRFYIQDFIVGTLSFSTTEIGAYLLLLIHQWDNGSIPDNMKELCSIARCRKATIMKVLTKFVLNENGQYFNTRMEEERCKQNKFSRKQTENGSKGGRPKKIDAEDIRDNKDKGLGFSGLDDSEAQKSLSFSLSFSNINNTPLPPEGEMCLLTDAEANANKKQDNKSVQKARIFTEAWPPVPLPFSSESFSKAWNDYKEYRKSIRKAIKSEKAELLALRQLKNKSGENEAVSIQILENSIANGWTGLFALSEADRKAIVTPVIQEQLLTPHRDAKELAKKYQG